MYIYIQFSCSLLFHLPYTDTDLSHFAIFLTKLSLFFIPYILLLISVLSYCGYDILLLFAGFKCPEQQVEVSSQIHW